MSAFRLKLMVLAGFLLLLFQASHTRAFPANSDTETRGYISGTPRYQGTDSDGLAIDLRKLDGTDDDLAGPKDNELNNNLNAVNPGYKRQSSDVPVVHDVSGNDDDLVALQDKERNVDSDAEPPGIHEKVNTDAADKAGSEDANFGEPARHRRMIVNSERILNFSPLELAQRIPNATPDGQISEIKGKNVANRHLPVDVDDVYDDDDDDDEKREQRYSHFQGTKHLKMHNMQEIEENLNNEKHLLVTNKRKAVHVRKKLDRNTEVIPKAISKKQPIEEPIKPFANKYQNNKHKTLMVRKGNGRVKSKKINVGYAKSNSTKQGNMITSAGKTVNKKDRGKTKKWNKQKKGDNSDINKKGKIVLGKQNTNKKGGEVAKIEKWKQNKKANLKTGKKGNKAIIPVKNPKTKSDNTSKGANIPKTKKENRVDHLESEKRGNNVPKSGKNYLESKDDKWKINKGGKAVVASQNTKDKPGGKRKTKLAALQFAKPASFAKKKGADKKRTNLRVRNVDTSDKDKEKIGYELNNSKTESKRRKTKTGSKRGKNKKGRKDAKSGNARKGRKLRKNKKGRRFTKSGKKKKTKGGRKLKNNKKSRKFAKWGKIRSTKSLKRGRKLKKGTNGTANRGQKNNMKRRKIAKSYKGNRMSGNNEIKAGKKKKRKTSGKMMKKRRVKRHAYSWQNKRGKQVAKLVFDQLTKIVGEWRTNTLSRDYVKSGKNLKNLGLGQLRKNNRKRKVVKTVVKNNGKRLGTWKHNERRRGERNDAKSKQKATENRIGKLREYNGDRKDVNWGKHKKGWKRGMWHENNRGSKSGYKKDRSRWSRRKWKNIMNRRKNHYRSKITNIMKLLKEMAIQENKENKSNIIWKQSSKQPNHCRSSPCSNGGTCISIESYFKCHCHAGFTGDKCETKIDECTSHPCQNGALCMSDGLGFQCQSLDGFEGQLCQHDINECSSSPCKNGALCSDEVNGFICECKKGFSGIHCEIDINECEGNPCSNGATCTDMAGRYECSCTAGFSGPNCETNNDICADSPCLNGGECIDGLNRFTCQCPATYTGNLCETMIDHCQFSPCMNDGKCKMKEGKYQCTCNIEFTGKDCEKLINPCNSGPCQHGGTCSSLGLDFSCTCPNDYQGNWCETPTDSCTNRPCGEGGVCKTISEAEYQCNCKSGYDGILCDTKLLQCENNPCKNGAACLAFDEYFRCQCPEAYEGHLCQIEKGHSKGLCADVNFCNGHGQCEYGKDRQGATCKCTKGWSGAHCEKPDPCAGYHCKNGGLCALSPLDPKKPSCKCLPGFTGLMCGKAVTKEEKENQGGSNFPGNPCDQKHCPNGGKCLAHKDKTYTCACPSGLRGSLCSNKTSQMSPCLPNPCADNDFCKEYAMAYDGYKCIESENLQRILTGTTVNTTAISPEDLQLNPDENVKRFFDSRSISSFVLGCVLIIVSVSLPLVMYFSGWCNRSRKRHNGHKYNGLNGIGQLSDIDVELGENVDDNIEITAPWFCPCFTKTKTQRTQGMQYPEPGHRSNVKEATQASRLDEDCNNNNNIPFWQLKISSASRASSPRGNHTKESVEAGIMYDISLSDDETDGSSIFHL